MTVKIARCLFEQSGTFRDAFRRLGIESFDYDIRNDFGKTDIQLDLFEQIEKAYNGKWSIFDDFTEEDILIAFFPCTYFCGNNELFFNGTNYAWRALPMSSRLDRIIDRAREREEYYVRLIKLCYIAEVRGLRLIIENPYNAHHYLRFNFPYKPAVIDMNRRLSGDYYRKPTQYIFINCKPAANKSMQLVKPIRYIESQKTIDRSLISPDYAYNFICDKILDKNSGHTIPSLFN